MPNNQTFDINDQLTQDWEPLAFTKKNPSWWEYLPGTKPSYSRGPIVTPAQPKRGLSRLTMRNRYGETVNVVPTDNLVEAYRVNPGSAVNLNKNIYGNPPKQPGVFSELLDVFAPVPPKTILTFLGLAGAPDDKEVRAYQVPYAFDPTKKEKKLTPFGMIIAQKIMQGDPNAEFYKKWLNNESKRHRYQYMVNEIAKKKDNPYKIFSQIVSKYGLNPSDIPFDEQLRLATANYTQSPWTTAAQLEAKAKVIEDEWAQLPPDVRAAQAFKSKLQLFNKAYGEEVADYAKKKVGFLAKPIEWLTSWAAEGDISPLAKAEAYRRAAQKIRKYSGVALTGAAAVAIPVVMLVLYRIMKAALSGGSKTQQKVTRKPKRIVYVPSTRFYKYEET